MTSKRLTIFRFRNALAMLLALTIIAGCAGNDEEFDLTSSIQDAYVEAQEAVAVGNYRKAIGIF